MEQRIFNILSPCNWGFDNLVYISYSNYGTTHYILVSWVYATEVLIFGLCITQTMEERIFNISSPCNWGFDNILVDLTQIMEQHIVHRLLSTRFAACPQGLGPKQITSTPVIHRRRPRGRPNIGLVFFPFTMPQKRRKKKEREKSQIVYFCHFFFFFSYSRTCNPQSCMAILLFYPKPMTPHKFLHQVYIRRSKKANKRTKTEGKKARPMLPSSSNNSLTPRSRGTPTIPRSLVEATSRTCLDPLR